MNWPPPYAVESNDFKFYFERSVLPTPFVVKAIAKDFTKFAEKYFAIFTIFPSV